MGAEMAMIQQTPTTLFSSFGKVNGPNTSNLFFSASESWFEKRLRSREVKYNKPNATIEILQYSEIEFEKSLRSRLITVSPLFEEAKEKYNPISFEDSFKRLYGVVSTFGTTKETMLKNIRFFPIIIDTIEIEIPLFEESYTAFIKNDGSGWSGWVPDIPEVNCQTQTKEDLLDALKNKLQENLEAEEEEWERQFRDLVESGKLDPLRKEALEDVRSGKFTSL